MQHSNPRRVPLNGSHSLRHDRSICSSPHFHAFTPFLLRSIETPRLVWISVGQPTAESSYQQLESLNVSERVLDRWTVCDIYFQPDIETNRFGNARPGSFITIKGPLMPVELQEKTAHGYPVGWKLSPVGWKGIQTRPPQVAVCWDCSDGLRSERASQGGDFALFVMSWRYVKARGILLRKRRLEVQSEGEEAESRPHGHGRPGTEGSDVPGYERVAFVEENIVTPRRSWSDTYESEESSEEGRNWDSYRFAVAWKSWTPFLLQTTFRVY